MNWAHVHLALNHAPVIGVFGVALLLVIALAIRNVTVARIAAGFLVLLAVITVIVYLTGDAAEHLVEELPGVSHDAIEHHEGVSFYSTVVMVVAGVTALFPLLRWSRPERYSGRTLAIVLAVTLIGCGVMVWTANTGGRIRHTEIQPALSAAEHVAGGALRV
ncbi:MAG TPA: hypothetical protein VNZ57_11635 [Longimicrobiales bacterium]|nr:hypothetical protein [Longimicrobiales bacterium]